VLLSRGTDLLESQVAVWSPEDRCFRQQVLLTAI